MILENCDRIIQRWLQEVAVDSRLSSIRISDDERIDRFPLLLNDLANLLEEGAGAPQIPLESLSAAAVHGADRAKQGYTIPLLVAETRILNRVIATVLHENLLTMNLSTLIPEALKIGEYLQALLEESIRAFQAAEAAPQVAAANYAAAVPKKVKAKAS